MMLKDLIIRNYLINIHAHSVEHRQSENVVQSQESHQHGSSTKEFEQVSQRGVTEARVLPENHILEGPYRFDFLLSLWHTHIYTHMHTDGDIFVCMY